VNGLYELKLAALHTFMGREVFGSTRGVSHFQQGKGITCR